MSCCPTCKGTYNKTRKPYILGCGHTFCCLCLQEKAGCLSCTFHGNPVLNLALFEEISRKNHLNIDRYLKVCLFGNMNVGKSSIINRMVDGEFEYHMNPTIGIDFKYIDEEVQGELWRFQIWDSAGQERYRSMSSHHLKGSDVILLVYDVSATFEDNGLSYWMGQIDNYAKHSNIIVIGNKKDLLKKKPTLNPNKKILKQEEQDSKKPALLDSEIKSIQAANWKHLTVSCLENENIQEIWRKVIEMSKEHTRHKEGRKKREIKISEGGYGHMGKKQKTKKQCCQ